MQTDLTQQNLMKTMTESPPKQIFKRMKSTNPFLENQPSSRLKATITLKSAEPPLFPDKVTNPSRRKRSPN